MGVTVHFEGQLRAPAAYSVLIDDLRDFATAHGWPAEVIAEEHTTLKRVRDERDWDYRGATFGLQLLPHPNADPLRFEFDTDYFVQEYVKTQFAGTETHVAIIMLLRRIQPFFESLAVEDEGEFWETADEATLARHIESCDRALHELLVERSNARGPVRLPSGRIVDYIS